MPKPDEIQPALDINEVYDALDVGVLVQDRLSAILYANRAAVELLGLNAQDELVGRSSTDPDWDVIDADGRPLPAEVRPVAIVVATGEAMQDRVLGVMRPNGERAWVLANAKPRFNVDGALRDVIVTLADISTERQRLLHLQEDLAARDSALDAARRDRIAAEQERDASDATYRSVVGVMTEGVAVHDETGAIQTANPAAERILGLTLEQMTGKEAVDPEWALIDVKGHPLTAERIPSEITATTGRPCHEVLLGVQRPKGERAWLRVSTVPLPKPERDPGARWPVVATFVDVTEERNLQKQLRHSQRREAMGDIAAGIAHNFNNMLAVILPNLAEALSHQQPPDVKEPLEDALHATQGATDLVQQLLALTRRDESGPHESVDMSSVASDVAGLCRSLFDRTITFTESLAPVGNAVVRGHPSQLKQALLNLCINARDATQDVDTPVITLGVRRRGDSVEAWVQDNGSGMTDEVREHLGEPFFTTKAPGAGTGLGLASVFSTLRDHSGEVECHSEVGAGTRFILRLPGIDIDQSTAALPEVPTAKKVLLIDDEAMVRRTFRRVLQKRGFDVDEAEHGQQGLDKVTDADFDLVVLDLSMPGLPSVEVLARLKQLRPALPVAVLSGFVRPELDLTAAQAVLHKPIAPDQLVREVRALVGDTETKMR